MTGYNEPTTPTSGFESQHDCYPSSSVGHNYSCHSNNAVASSSSIPFRSLTSTTGKRMACEARDFIQGDGNGPVPESWTAEMEGEDLQEREFLSPQDVKVGHRRRSITASVNPSARTSMSAGFGALPPLPVDKLYHIRIYLANNSYRIVSIGLPVTVASLTPALNSKLPISERETCKLYLKERGRERLVALTERPADFVRQRLKQVGYDTTDDLEFLGAEDFSFLFKFVYKSHLLGPAVTSPDRIPYNHVRSTAREEELMFDNFELIDLTGRSIRTIPVAMYDHAYAIVSLKLSRNPGLKIPLEFIQSCTSLRELRLSDMAIRKVPQSVRHSTTLHRLDLSCNRIVDLDEAGLDRIPELKAMFMQNNRMEQLPWYFPRLLLVTLNISNNKFRSLPTVITEMINLRDLDISFNLISELPDELGQLTALERLVIVGNQVLRLPDSCRNLSNLRLLDCRRNQISDLRMICMLPRLEKLSADHNSIHLLDLSLGPCVTTLDVSYNEIMRLSLIAGPIAHRLSSLTSLNVSYAKLSSLDDLALGQLSSLQVLQLDHNSFHSIPESLGDLGNLETLSCSNNRLDFLPSGIGNLQKLKTLDAHHNNLFELPVGLWNCASLAKINVTSNSIRSWHDPPTGVLNSPGVVPVPDTGLFVRGMKQRTPSTVGSIGRGHVLPPLAHSLEKLYLGGNRVKDATLQLVSVLKELRVLNISFNGVQSLPPKLFEKLTKLEELHLSGNKLTRLPIEDLAKHAKLAVLFLNGNRLQTLPQELGRIQSLTVLDVGSNLLNYNINNWESDWNWSFNRNLKYLNLSGNKGLQIKPDTSRSNRERQSPGFTNLTQLRALGLVDVTITSTGNIDIPDEEEDRRVRTSSSTVNGMAYGIADSLGRNGQLNVLDLVHEFRGQRQGEAIFAIFGRAQPPKYSTPSTNSGQLVRYLYEEFPHVFLAQLDGLNQQRNEGVPDALRRSFLKLNRDLHGVLHSGDHKVPRSRTSNVSAVRDASVSRNGASGIVLYFTGKTMYVGNVGNMLAVVSRRGTAELVSRRHDPFDRSETARIRAAEGWVSPPGLVNDEIDVSRAFGFYHLLPVVNARPDVHTWDLSKLDEFVIVGNRGLWDHVSYQTAVDIARTERADLMIAAQKLRDFAISYGAEGGVMVMVIGVADLFKNDPSRSKQATTTDVSHDLVKRTDGIADRRISSSDRDAELPGRLASVSNDIRHLWEVNPSMPAAMRIHNDILRRQLHEVRSESRFGSIPFWQPPESEADDPSDVGVRGATLNGWWMKVVRYMVQWHKRRRILDASNRDSRS